MLPRVHLAACFMISAKPAPAAAATKTKLAACAATLLLLGACASFARVPSQQVASSAAASSATPSAPIYRKCDGQNVKETALAACNVAAGEYKNQMSEHGCDWTKFFTYGCWECCGVIAPYPPSPPPPSPPLLANKWANAGLNTGITFAKFGAGTAFTFGTSNPFTTDYGKLGQQTGESFSEQGMKEAHGYVALDDTGIAKTVTAW